jgi:palmitoyl-protein thioesterase
MVAANQSLYGDGFHMVCKSQGGMICRCAIEAMANHVDTFVSLAGPQAGVYGSAFFASFEHNPLLENLTMNEVWRVAYTKPVQALLSVANLWRDPKHLPEYTQTNLFMQKYTHNATAAMKVNFGVLKKAVFCVGSGHPYDGGIEPWQTGVWGSQDTSGRMVPMVEQPYYLADTFGLRTLDSSGRLNITVVPNVTHEDWTGDADIIKEYVLPHLT